ncbi:MAG TPA: DUF2388 domain-containing protein [Pseudomonas sp.]|nr:DUF2388 domain-containing protein [Pseudomonas sp.]
MTRLQMLTAAGLLAVVSGASASSFIATTDTLGSATANASESTSDATSKSRDDKVVLAARPDAASFVASDGAIRGARLEAALQRLREQNPQLQGVGDRQLAEAILAL